MMKSLLNDVAESSDRPSVPSADLAVWAAQVTAGAVRACKKELFKPEFLPHCRGFGGK